MNDWQSEVRARLAALRLKPEREADIVDEIAQHLAERYREAMSGGAEPEEALRAALAEFRPGNVLAQRIAALRQAKEPQPIPFGAPGGRLLADLWTDLRLAARMLRRSPGFTLVAAQVEAQQLGLFFVSPSGPAAVPFLGGTLCLGGSVLRLTPSNSGGAGACSGQLSTDANAWLAANQPNLRVPGQPFWAQCWFRDPLAPIGQIGLSNALNYVLAP